MARIRSWFAFDGRISRRLYWSSIVLIFFAIVVLFIAQFYLYQTAPVIGVFLGLLVEFLFIPLAIILLATMSKRLHDIGASGFWALTTLVLFKLPIIVVGILPGDKSTNRWGAPTSQSS